MHSTLLAFAVAAAAACQTPETAEAIMARVAANQDRAEQLRSSFVYRQSLLMRMRRTNHKLAREERSEFTVIPGLNGIEKKLEHFAGLYERDGKYIGYDHSRYKFKDVDLDGELISDLGNWFTSTPTRDGIAKDLFPLTAEEQRKYTFRLAGRETRRGRDVYRIAFRPRPDVDGAAWSGEATIDAREFQPVHITTRLARGVPFWVRTLLGTNLKYTGFSLAYDRFEEGVWFPVSYGGEFELKAVFFYKRLISVSLENSRFERTNVESAVSYHETAN